MEQHFKLAHKWACVLLIDEADVFLAKRTVSNLVVSMFEIGAYARQKTDIKRNGLVSGTLLPLSDWKYIMLTYPILSVSENARVLLEDPLPNNKPRRRHGRCISFPPPPDPLLPQAQ